MARTDRTLILGVAVAAAFLWQAPASIAQPADAAPAAAGQAQGAYASEQALLARLSVSSALEDRLQWLALLETGTLVKDGNPLRMPQTAELRRVLLDLTRDEDDPVWTEAAAMLARDLAGSALPEDQTRARALLEALAERNHGSSMMLLRDILLRENTAGNAARADGLLRRAVLAGSYDALITLYSLETDAAARTSLLGAIQQEPARRIAGSNDGSAALRLASELTLGTLFARDVERAVKLYRVAIDLDERNAAFLAFRRLSELDEGKVTPETLRGFLLEAASAGSIEAAETIIEDAVAAGPLGFTMDAAEPWLRHAVDAGSARAVLALDALSRRQALPDGFAPDLLPYIQALEASPTLRPIDHVLLGRFYLDGQTVQKDSAKAKAYFEKALAAGETGAQVHYAELLLNDPAGTPTERNLGVMLLQQAAAAGSVAAMVALGDTVVFGRDIPYTFDAARGWYEQAMSAGNSLAATRKLAELLIDRGGSPAEISRGLAMLRDAADAGNSSAMIRLADLHARGRLVPVDREFAAQLLRDAIETGSLRARIALADLLSEGLADVDVPDEVLALYMEAFERGLNSAARRSADILIAKQDGRAAAALLQKAVDRGVASAAVRLADMLQEGVLVPRDIDRAAVVLERAIQLGDFDNDVAVDLADTMLASADKSLRLRGVGILERVADTGESDAMRSLARFWRTTGVNGPDMQAAVRWSEQAADAGVVSELVWLGNAYRTGSVVPRDDARSLALFERALALDPTNSAATIAVGQAYLNGIGTPADPKRAFAFFERAADRGDTEAKIVLARMLAEGLGVEPNPAAAFEQLQGAVELGSVSAKVSLGRFYASGFGTDIVPEASFAQFMGAALGGSAEGMREVGRCYLAGFGAPLDLEQGRMWLERAARADHSGAKVDLSVFLFAQAEARPAEAAALNSEAMVWLASAADDGNAAALFRLGVSRYFGLVTEQDTLLAKEALTRSAALGNFRASKLLANIEKAERERKTLDQLPAEIDPDL
ncbi:MAG: sel1 repeat family protein [Rhizobiaceae bacterium]|jgi:hypothetical protein|nr:sel1 repeat family protein [Rhizobiaceae bacterium]